MNRYYVYRFINNSNVITYVGRTINLPQRFLNHSHLTNDIKKIEYIECQSEADMIWKEIYYINLFKNEKTTNSSSIYAGNVSSLALNDKWKLFKLENHKYNLNLSRVLSQEYISKINANKIHIIEDRKLNEIGKDYYALSENWFRDNNVQLIKLSHHVSNYFRHKCNAKTAECLWTTFDECKNKIFGKGFRKGFISLNEGNTLSPQRKYLAFLCNIFYGIHFSGKNITQDEFALSEILQFIWRSAIRDGEEIWIYIPSIRMRRLLYEWIEEQNNLNEVN